MTTKTVSQYDNDGYFTGTGIAYESPLEKGVFLMPANSIEIPAPEVKEGYKYKLSGNKWIEEKIVVPTPKPFPEPTALELAEGYLVKTSWMLEEGIIDFYPNAAEIKAARIAAINVLKNHKSDLKMDAPDFK